MMEVIKQTNRTILFEQFNPQMPDLMTLVGESKDADSLSDEVVREIEEKLLVRTFDEFLEKFRPVIYSYFDAGNNRVLYTLKKPDSLPEDMYNEIPIDKGENFLTMLCTLIDSKSSLSVANVDFKFDSILKLITPEKVMDDIRQTRKEIHTVYEKYELLEEGDPQKLDLADRLNSLMEEASAHYNNVLAMLPLAIEDVKLRLLLGSGGANGQNSEQLRIGTLSMGESGELKIIEAPKVDTKALALSEGVDETGLAKTFAEDYEAITDEKSDYVKDLVVRTFCPLLATQSSTALDVAQEVDNYNSYLDFYRRSKDDFIKVVKPLIENILGVKMFFEQYRTKTKGGMRPALLITNLTPEMITKSFNMPRLEIYLNTVNNKNDFDKTIWYGIVPSIELNPSKRKPITRERFKGNQEVIRTDLNTMESLSILLRAAKNYKFQIFFSFEGSERTSFNYLATKGIEELQDRCRPLVSREYSEFSIPCMPNFTVLPKDRSGVILDNKMSMNDKGAVILSKAKEDIMRLWIEGVYIGASYVAAGLMAACQCPEYLKERFKRVNADYPGVRFDIESKDNALRVPTAMAKEISGYTDSIKNSINRSNFGFVFASETFKQGNRSVSNVTVYKARSLETMPEGGFEACFKTQYSTYLFRMLRYISQDFKEDNVKLFFSSNPTSQKSLWERGKGCVNSVLQDGDNISYAIDTASNTVEIIVDFDGDVKTLDVDIRKRSLRMVEGA